MMSNVDSGSSRHLLMAANSDRVRAHTTRAVHPLALKFSMARLRSRWCPARALHQGMPGFALPFAFERIAVIIKVAAEAANASTTILNEYARKLPFIRSRTM